MLSIGSNPMSPFIPHIYSGIPQAEQTKQGLQTTTTHTQLTSLILLLD